MFKFMLFISVSLKKVKLFYDFSTKPGYFAGSETKKHKQFADGRKRVCKGRTHHQGCGESGNSRSFYGISTRRHHFVSKPERR